MSKEASLKGYDKETEAISKYEHYSFGFHNTFGDIRSLHVRLTPLEDGFTYEKDGTTRLELILWSSNKDLLPEKVQAEGKDFHTVGIDFEPNELKGDFGEYRVTVWKAEAPYPISMIRTGVYAKGGWVWQDNIRPFYHFFKPQ